MEVFLVYLWLKLDSIRTFIHVMFGVALPLLALVFFAVRSSGYDLFDEPPPEWVKAREAKNKPTNVGSYAGPRFVGVVVFAFASHIFAGLMPTSNQTAALVATYYAVSLAKSEEGNKVLTLVRAKANEFLDSELSKITQPKGETK